MRTSHTFTGLATVCVLALAACSHDLDALKVPSGGNGSAGQGSGGNGGSGNGSAGSGHAGSGASGSGASGSGSSGSGGSAGAGNSTACEPCAAPPAILGDTVKPTSCCTGSRGEECGEKFPAVDRCYALDVPGSQDTTCLALSRGKTTYPGCCRPDGECGVVIDSLNLGCVIRSEVQPVLGGPLSPLPRCVPKCGSDADCMGLKDNLICAEDNTRARFCATFCARDKDCESLAGGLVCAIQNNVAENRVDTVCRKPFGSAKAGEACTDPSDCVHGTCLPDAGNATGKCDNTGASPCSCTELCGSDLDCTVDAASCVNGAIPTPDRTGKQTIRICH